MLGAVSAADAIDRVRQAFVRHWRGEWAMPSKVYLDSPGFGDFRAMPARGDGLALLKWVTSFPGNPARGLPTVTGIVCLSDAETGEPLMLLDARSVTALRTGASAAVAAGALAPRGRAVGGRHRLRAQRSLGRQVPGGSRLRARGLLRSTGGRRRCPRRRARLVDRFSSGGPGVRRRLVRHTRLFGRRRRGRHAPRPSPQHARRRRPGEGRGDRRRRWARASSSATSGTRPHTAES